MNNFSVPTDTVALAAAKDKFLSAELSTEVWKSKYQKMTPTTSENLLLPDLNDTHQLLQLLVTIDTAQLADFFKSPKTMSFFVEEYFQNFVQQVFAIKVFKNPEVAELISKILTLITIFCTKNLQTDNVKLIETIAQIFTQYRSYYNIPAKQIYLTNFNV